MYMDGAVDITTPGYEGTKSVKAEMSEAKMSEKFNKYNDGHMSLEGACHSVQPLDVRV